MSVFVGVIILALFLGGIFVVLANDVGFLEALRIVAGACVLTALLVVGIALCVGSLTF